MDNAPGQYAFVRIKDTHLKLIDSTRADSNGNYKIIIHAGVYRIWAGDVADGSMETTLLNLYSQRIMRLDFSLGNLDDLVD